MAHVLALVTEAFGGRGGIARYNRDFLGALALSPLVDKIRVLPRLAPDASGALPDKIEQDAAVFNALGYSASAVPRAMLKSRPAVVFCGHILMSPLAATLAAALRVPLWLQVHGIDAWSKPSRSVKWAAEQSALVTSVSRHTKLRMSEWWNGDPWRLRVLPNTVGTQFGPGPKPDALLDRYGLRGRRVILTVSRLSYPDRYKGHERIIASLPAVRRSVPDAAYLIVGDGDDAARLAGVASAHGVGESVVFAGHVSEGELPDHFRVADVYAMPSTKEGFGIVFLEAALSGLPVIGGNQDGSVDALADGTIGHLVDPDTDDGLVAALIAALTQQQATRVGEANRFAFENFAGHVDHLLRSLVH